MDDIVRLSLDDLDDFLKSLIVYFPDDNIKRQDWIELLEDEKLLFMLSKKMKLKSEYCYL